MKKIKYLIITVDAEEDNQWSIDSARSTNNSRNIPVFQELCEKYGFKPVYLTTFDMANDPFFVEYLTPKIKENMCEIGMHMHGWNCPPYYELTKTSSFKPFITEYPSDVIEEKVRILTNLLKKRFNTEIYSHRSGRWAIDKDYIKILKNNGYLIDCSVTPYINWAKKEKSASNYSDCNIIEDISNVLFEVPMTIVKTRKYFTKKKTIKEFLKLIKRFLFKGTAWLRPSNNSNTLREMLYVEKINSKKSDTIMFMIHSSELMNGCNPNFKTKEDIDILFANIDSLFKILQKKGYVGITLYDYFKLKKNNI